MHNLLRHAKRLWSKAPLAPLRFPTTAFEIVSETHILEEEQFKDFKAGRYYPVNIGDIFNSKYQVVGKLGFGVTSTVWLARDLLRHDLATLKVYTREGVDEEEFKIYQSLSKGNSAHPGPGGDHASLVQKPMWDNFRDLLKRNPSHRFTEELLKSGLAQGFLALDYLHNDCRLIHTDIKADNILISIEDEMVLESFVKGEIEHPSPRKFVNNAPVYMSRRFDLPKSLGKVVLSDFGSAVHGDQRQIHDAQPDVYRCPEVMLKTEWSYPADIWNVGCMIWDIFENKHLFYGIDPDGTGYKTPAHLAEVIALLGPPPLEFVRRGSRSQEFFSDDGDWIVDVPIPENSFEESEENLGGQNKEEFIRFMKAMLQWKPEDRKTAAQLLRDPWLKDVVL